MTAMNYTNARKNLKKYCDKAVQECETVIITRKNDENVVIMSENTYNNLVRRLIALDCQQPEELTKGITNEQI